MPLYLGGRHKESGCIFSFFKIKMGKVNNKVWINL